MYPLYAPPPGGPSGGAPVAFGSPNCGWDIGVGQGQNTCYNDPSHPTGQTTPAPTMYQGTQQLVEGSPQCRRRWSGRTMRACLGWTMRPRTGTWYGGMFDHAMIDYTTTNAENVCSNRPLHAPVGVWSLDDQEPVDGLACTFKFAHQQHGMHGEHPRLYAPAHARGGRRASQVHGVPFTCAATYRRPQGTRGRRTCRPCKVQLSTRWCC